MLKSKLILAVVMILALAVAPVMAQMVVTDPGLYAVAVDQMINTVKTLENQMQMIDYYYQQLQIAQQTIESIDITDLEGTMRAINRSASTIQDIKRFSQNFVIPIGNTDVNIRDLGTLPEIFKMEWDMLTEKEYTKEENRDAFKFFGFSEDAIQTAEDLGYLAGEAGKAILYLGSKVVEAAPEVLDRATEALSYIGQNQSQVKRDVKAAEIEVMVLDQIAILNQNMAAFTMMMEAERRRQELFGAPMAVAPAQMAAREYGFSEEFVSGGTF